MKKNKDIKVGQKLYVKRNEMFGRYESDDLDEYEVTKVNTVSIYAKVVGSDYEIRFDKRKLIYSNGMGSVYKAYLDPNVYWEEVNKRKELHRLRGKITDLIPDLNIDELEKIYQMIKEK